MSTLKTILITLTMTAFGVSGAVQARDHSGEGHLRGDSGRFEQSAYHHDDANSSRVDRRQDRQHMRIRQGLRNGQLSHGEHRMLKREQRHIARMERRLSADGYLSGRDRRRLEKAQDSASRDISWAKHNPIYKGSGHYAGSRHGGHRESHRGHRSY